MNNGAAAWRDDTRRSEAGTEFACQGDCVEQPAPEAGEAPRMLGPGKGVSPVVQAKPGQDRPAPFVEIRGDITAKDPRARAPGWYATGARCLHYFVEFGGCLCGRYPQTTEAEPREASLTDRCRNCSKRKNGVDHAHASASEVQVLR